jgi:hypothetical protein
LSCRRQHLLLVVLLLRLLLLLLLLECRVCPLLHHWPHVKIYQDIPNHQAHIPYSLPAHNTQHTAWRPILLLLLWWKEPACCCCYCRE